MVVTLAEAEDYAIYTGPWINWSRGPVYGASLTLSRADANLLIAFVSTFVAWGAFAALPTCTNVETLLLNDQR